MTSRKTTLKVKTGKAEMPAKVKTAKTKVPVQKEPPKPKTARAKAPAQEKPITGEPWKSFRIVAIGASAGGLEAFEVFFRNLPPSMNAAFIVISHLDPRHSSMMSELIGRFTQMKVSEARDGVEVETANVYVIPPNRELSILDGKLYLTEPGKDHVLRMPIDFFLRSLADDQGDRSIAVILSGTGSDGSLGIRALQAAGGLIFAEQPEDARYSGMPESAIKTGVVDYILPVKDIALQLAGFIDKHQKVLAKGDEEPSSAELQKVLAVVRARTGHDFSQYKKNTMQRRIRRRMSIHNLRRTEEYVHFLREHPEEVQHLFKELLITVTSFFRDPEAFEAFKAFTLPAILSNVPDDYTVRIWVPGCATGEEAYSFAILIQEFAEETGKDYKVQMFATDIDETSIIQARTGLFPTNIALDVSEARLAKYFVKEPGGFRVRKDIRESIIFATHDLVKDAPFTHLDIVSCRNVLIYMEPELQNRIVTVFHYGLNTGGVLLLGSSESVGNRTDLFRMMDKKWKVFQSKPATGLREITNTTVPLWPRDVIPSTAQAKMPVKTDIEETVRQGLLAQYAPPAVVVDEKGDILYVHGNMAPYLTPVPGRASLNIAQMTREGLRFAMRSALMAAASHKHKATYRNVKVKTNGGSEMVDLSISLLAGGEDEPTLYMFTFQTPLEKKKERARTDKPSEVDQERVAELEKELLYTRENLQATAEEAQAANEELKSANEELQSSNEELQSTNEELETSKEELQSVNEELTTVNGELRSKIDLLTRSENDIKHLLDSTEIATIFLDKDLRIKRFNTSASRIINLIPSDVGRPIDDVTFKIRYQELTEKARGVVDTLQAFATEVQGKDEDWYLMRIVPYRTVDNVIDGAVMTFTNITESRRAAEVRQEFLENLVETVPEPFLVLDGDLKVVMANRNFFAFFKVTREETEGRVIKDLGGHEWNIRPLHDLLVNIIKTGSTIEGYRLDADFLDIGKRTLIVNARKIRSDDSQKNPLILLAMREAT